MKTKNLSMMALLGVLAFLATGCDKVPDLYVQNVELCGTVMKGGSPVTARPGKLKLILRNDKKGGAPLVKEWTLKLGSDGSGRACLKFSLGNYSGYMSELTPEHLSMTVDGKIAGPKIVNKGGRPDFDYLTSTVEAELVFNLDESVPSDLYGTGLFGLNELIELNQALGTRMAENRSVSGRSHKALAEPGSSGEREKSPKSASVAI